MKPVNHPSNTRTLGAPAGWDQSTLPVEPLGITDQVLEGVPCMWSFWQPDADELAALNAGGAVVLSIVGRNMPPAALMVTTPDSVPEERSDAIKCATLHECNSLGCRRDRVGIAGCTAAPAPEAGRPTPSGGCSRANRFSPLETKIIEAINANGKDDLVSQLLIEALDIMDAEARAYRTDSVGMPACVQAYATKIDRSAP